MKYKRFKLSTILLLGLGLTSVQAQEAILATGGKASGDGGSVSYSVGQVVYSTNTGANGSVAQGVQQPYEISVVAGIEQATGIMLELSAYPNPASDFITVKAENYDTDNISYQLFDINGKLLENKKAEGDETQIEMNIYLPAIYFLKAIENNEEIKTFKIVKK
ncbi:MAG: T9SS type A sorting domain-containing protein [Bacteroidota bacterium]|nr:T9SS type A sorting domain-containing protein [Bacteroidota bacterium]